MEDLFTNDKDFDTTLIVKGKEFQSHRSLLAARSSVFAAMFEHDMTENATGIVNIPDCDEEAFGDFLRYLYSGRVLSLSLERALCLYFIAAKYEVQQLKMLCVQVMVKNLSLEKFNEVVLCAEQYGEIELFSAVQYFFNKNVKEIAMTEKWDTLLKDNPCLGNKLLIGMSEELPDDVIPELPDDEIPVELGMPEIIIFQNDRIPIHVPDDGMSDEYSDDD